MIIARTSAPKQQDEGQDHDPSDCGHEQPAGRKADAGEAAPPYSCAEVEPHRRRLPRQVHAALPFVSISNGPHQVPAPALGDRNPPSRLYSVTRAQGSIGRLDLDPGVLVAGSEAK